MRKRTNTEDAEALKAQEGQFTDEGAPPPGVVGTEMPASRLHRTSEGRCETERQSLVSLVGQVRIAEKERDALSTFAQEELYLSACSRVEAIEHLLEKRMGASGRPDVS